MPAAQPQENLARLSRAVSLRAATNPLALIIEIRIIFLPVAANPSTEIAMPQKTLADTLAARETIHVNCGHPMCCKSMKLDIQALIDRLGRDHGSMHDNLVGLFVCSNCNAAGRDRRQVFFTCIPDYEGQQRARNRDWKPTFEREG
ncbi:hypothetical protein [Mesorhizobium sp.]|uniref:hypothetical protein n=1 Tax=Mesorhizobium sp. TaxID=1871066 RepID=UPI00257D82BE|nr:hypothetical protein [Mesorhizobium sp.]